MIKLSYDQNRVFAGVLLGVLLLSAANYYLDLGYFGRFAKLILVASLGVRIVWGAFWAPTRQGMAQHLNKEK